VLKEAYANPLPRSKRAKNDLVTNQLISFKCPYALSRINHPVKSVKCTHDQCFDLLYFLEGKDGGGSFKCPVCSVSVEVGDLRIDERFAGLIEKYSVDDRCFVDNDGRDWVVERKRRSVIRID
jgi:hypothetical protein